MVMVFFTEKPMRVLAACCKVEVMNGALGLVRVGRSSRLLTTKVCADISSRAAWVVAPSEGLKFSPFCLVTSKRRASSDPWRVKSANRSQYSSGRKARISRSRSTIRRTATLCTRPADKPRATFDQSSGDNSKPTTRSKNRRACWAWTLSMSISPGSTKAA